MNDITYVGLDVHKATVCVAIAESGRGVRYCAVERIYLKNILTRYPVKIMKSRREAFR
jgi:hypothetical protein